MRSAALKTKLAVKVAVNPSAGETRIDRMIERLDIMFIRILSELASETENAILSTMRTKTGAMKSGMQSMSEPIESNGKFWIGVGSIKALDAATDISDKAVDPNVVHGYWFNVEFARKSQYEKPEKTRSKKTFRVVKQENPKTHLPMGVYRIYHSWWYYEKKDEGRRGPGENLLGGMLASRAIRRGMLTTLVKQKTKLNGEIKQMLNRYCKPKKKAS